MATSKVDICNRALTLCGARRITQLTDNSEAAAIVNEEYDNSREELLISHPWNFAIKRVSLGLDVTAPSFEFSYRFQLPSDCLRVLATNLLGDEPYQIENGFLLTNASDVKIKYISDITDVSKFSRNFETALAYTIADVVCFKVSGNASLSQTITAKAQIKVREARSYDAQEGSAPVSENTAFWDVRF